MQMVYITLINHPEYEIETEFPHRIRRIGEDEPISDRTRSGGGYVTIKLNSKPYYLHRIIAEQFIPNPHHYEFVDHINHIKDDNHVNNLRWVTQSENQRNQSSYRGVSVDYIEYEDAPEDLIYVTDYNNHHFEDYYYSQDSNLFYFDTGVNYRVLHINIDKRTDSAFVCVKDTNYKQVKIYFTKFKYLYNLQ